MRDKKRIPRIGVKIMQLWNIHPDLRFGQFVTYLHNLSNNKADIFNMEDKEWERTLDLEIARLRKEEE